MNTMKAFNDYRIHVQLTIQCNVARYNHRMANQAVSLQCYVAQQIAELEAYRCLQALSQIRNVSPKFRSFLNLPAVAFKF